MTVASPCVNICYLDDDDVCQGCFRSGDEITAWQGLDDAGKRAVLEKVRERERASPFVIIRD